jgi:hypothetical protein
MTEKLHPSPPQQPAPPEKTSAGAWSLGPLRTTREPSYHALTETVNSYFFLELVCNKILFRQRHLKKHLREPTLLLWK